MAYVSIIAKIDEKINNLIALAYELDHDYNYNIGSGGVCQWYEVNCLEKKREKILSNLILEVEKHELYDEGGYMLNPIFTVFCNGKQNKKEFYIGDTLPNGEKLEYITVKLSNPYFV